LTNLPPFDPFDRSAPNPNRPRVFADGERTRDPRCIALGIHPLIDTSRFPDGHPFFTDNRGDFRARFPKPKRPKPKNRSR
ncbi:hypothetical protein LLG95_13275, partial [bacterium]|nr:hypothetical protein [bacterium]